MSHDTLMPRRPPAFTFCAMVLIAAASLLLVGAGVARAADVAPPPVTEAAGEEIVAPVVVDGRTLFLVRGIRSFPAEARARRVTARIRALASDRNFSPKDLKVADFEVTSRITANGQLVMLVHDGDARLEGIARKTLARAYAIRIGEAVEAYRRERTATYLLRRGVYALAGTAALFVLLWVGGRLMRRVDAALERRVRGRLAGLEAKSLRIVSAANLWRALLGFRRLVWTVAVFLAILFYLDFVLRLFPWSRWLGLRLFDLLVDPLRALGQGLLTAIPDLIVLGIIVIGTRYVLKALRLVFAGIEQGTVSFSGFRPEWAWPTHRLVRLLILAFAVVVAYPFIPGSGSGAFKGVSIFLGVIFSLGSTSLIGNILAGYSLVYRRAFQVGDRVRINEHVGDVMETRLMVTHLHTPKNEEIIVPNSEIINASVVNYSTLAREGKLILHTTVGIGYETPWRQVEAMLLEAAARTEGLLAEPPPFVLQRNLGDFAVTYEINAYCGDAQAMYRLYARLHQNILDLFNEYGVQIMTPAYEGDPGQPKVVPKDQWYAAPASAPSRERR